MLPAASAAAVVAALAAVREDRALPGAALVRRLCRAHVRQSYAGLRGCTPYCTGEGRTTVAVGHAAGAWGMGHLPVLVRFL